MSESGRRKGAKAYVLGIIPDKANRQRDDWYVTPPEATRVLLDSVVFNGVIWEPACGDGAISKVLIEHGHEVISSDLIDRGYGETNRDFLLDWTSTVPNVITNPPFKHAEEFALHALERTTHKVALLCRLAWLEGRDRRKMFINTPLAQVLVFSNRIPMRRNNEPSGGGMIAFAWFVWDHAHTGKPTIDFLVADRIDRPRAPGKPQPEPKTPDLFAALNTHGSTEPDADTEKMSEMDADPGETLVTLFGAL